MCARVSNHAQHSLNIVFRNPQDCDGPNLKAAAWVFAAAQSGNLELVEDRD
jgi:hypothetical protein